MLPKFSHPGRAVAPRSAPGKILAVASSGSRGWLRPCRCWRLGTSEILLCSPASPSPGSVRRSERF